MSARDRDCAGCGLPRIGHPGSEEKHGHDPLEYRFQAIEYPYNPEWGIVTRHAAVAYSPACIAKAIRELVG